MVNASTALLYLHPCQFMHHLTLQATIKEPAITNMRKGIGMAYTLISSTYLTVAIAGYWAFGNGVQAYLINSLSTPTWPVTIANLAAIVQITGCYQVSILSLLVSML